MRSHFKRYWKFAIVGACILSMVVSTSCVQRYLSMHELQEKVVGMHDKVSVGMSRKEVHDTLSGETLSYICDYTTSETPTQYRRFDEYYIVGDPNDHFGLLTLRYKHNGNELLLTLMSTANEKRWLPNEGSGCKEINQLLP